MIDAITRGYAETYATVHRGVYQRSAEMTLAFEASRARGSRASSMPPAPEEIVFVRGATEGINLVAQSWGRDNLKPGDRVLLSTLEHHSNIVPWQLAGAEIDVVPLTEDHRIDLDAMAAMIRPEHKLVALAHVSNVLGSVLDAKRAAEIAHKVGAKLLLDGCQAVPRMPVDVRGPRLRFLRLLRPQALRADRDRRALGPGRAARRDAAVAGRRRDDRQGDVREDQLRCRRPPASRRGRRMSSA